MKKICFLALMFAFVVAGCNDKDNGIEGNGPASEDNIVKSGFDEAFARELFRRGYIDDPQNITKDDVANITELDISYNSYDGRERLISLKGIEYFSSLEVLICYEHRLTTLDLRNNTALKSLTCFDNALTTLDLSNNTKLEVLYCFDNALTTLDVSNNTSLTSLDCSGNSLASLDVSNNTSLTSLDCAANSLTSLDVSNNTSLTDLDCSYNALISLDVSNNTALTDLSCYVNSLTSLDVSNNTALTRLQCSDNPGDGSVFPVFAWFDDTAVPSGFTTGSWDYQGSIVTVRYQQK